MSVGVRVRVRGRVRVRVKNRVRVRVWLSLGSELGVHIPPSGGPLAG